MALEPITRKEKIIAGQDLTPITRMEMFLKQHVGGGGGGGSVPKPLTYDYMPDGYPKKSVQTTTLMEEQEVWFTEDKGKYFCSLADPVEIVVGQTYIVNWDGTEYECICFEFNNIPLLGNMSVAGAGDDTGEPFVYSSASGNFVTIDASESHTISIKTTEETITPMAEEFLPNIPADKLPTVAGTTVFYI